MRVNWESVYFTVVNVENVIGKANSNSPLDWGCRILRLHLGRKVRPSTPTSILDMTLNNLMVHHHYHVVPLARISLTLSLHFPLSFIASGRSSGIHSLSSHSCCMYVQAGRLAFARPYAGLHKRTSLMTSSLLLQQCLACLVRLR